MRDFLIVNFKRGTKNVYSYKRIKAIYSKREY